MKLSLLSARNVVTKVLPIALLASIGGFVQLRSSPLPKLLIVHSYGPDLPWVGDVDLGFNASLRASNSQVQVRRHYMNLLSRPDCNRLREAAREAQDAIDDWQPEVVVLVDDLAQALVGVSQVQARKSGVPIAPHRDLVLQLTAGRCVGPRLPPPTFTARALFYAGVNGRPTDYGYDRAANVTGVLEHKNLPALSKLLQQINAVARPPAVALQLLNDQSSTALAEGTQYAGPHWSPLTWLDPVNVGTFSDWQHQVNAASRHGAMLLVANYQNLRDDEGRIVPAEKVIAWTERNSVYPVVGAGTSFVGDGGLVTAAMSGFEQGEVVARMSLHYLQGGELLPPQPARRLLIGLQCALVRKRHMEAWPLYRSLTAESGCLMKVNESVYFETEI